LFLLSFPNLRPLRMMGVMIYLVTQRERMKRKSRKQEELVVKLAC
jgi:hypothetical protein